MTVLDTLIYDPERLACSAEEKEACLETVRKLARLWFAVRREGVLAVLMIADSERDPFFHTCLLESGELYETETLERIFCAYLAAGNYQGGAFLNAVAVVKGLLLLQQDSNMSRQAWGDRLSAELRGFFGAAYREKVTAAIEQELQSRREISLVPDFDRLSQISLAQRQALLRETDRRTLAIALSAASVVATDALLGALTDDARAEVETSLPLLNNLREMDVTQAQETLMETWEAMKPSFM